MKILKGIAELDTPLRQTYVTIGNFDGVHLGHQSIINALVRRARNESGTSVVFTFRPHPQAALKPGVGVELITTYDEKLELLSQLSPDVIIEQPFSREFSTFSAEEFFEEVVLKRLSTKVISVGYDFGFGKGRSGNIEFLKDKCSERGIELVVTEPQSFAGDVCSSSRIRTYLHGGKVLEASRLLGRPFFYRGVVIKGDGRGHKIGFPTANVLLPNKVMVANGVYAVRAKIRGNQYWGLTNVGVRPTFLTQGHSTVETHILNFSGDIYGELLHIEFLGHLRAEMRFANKDDLTAQIAKDIAAAQKYFGE
jgi:riboflavin kinase/FMN adenylyltransferase